MANYAPYIDVEGGLARLRGNEKLFKKMLMMFLASEEMAKFEAAMAADEYAAAGDIAHAIKGMSGNLSLTKVYETSAELMVQLRQGPADAALLAEYREAIEKTLEYVKEYIA